MAEDQGRNRLGRGLAALIGDMESEPAAVDRGRPQRRLPIAFLRPNPRNPRRAFADADLDDLVASVREKGIIQPILVRPVGGPAGNTFEIVAGERRWRAAQKAGLHDVPVVVQEATDKEALELAIIENVQRADLNALEEARGYQQLIEDYGYSQAALAEVIGKSRPHVANMLSLLKLPEGVLAYLRDGRLSAGHARALVNVGDAEALARRIVEEGLSVRDAEAARQKESPKGRKSAPAQKDADTRAIEKSLSDHLGLAVSIDHRENGGSVRIAYQSLEQLDEICRRLQGS